MKVIVGDETGLVKTVSVETARIHKMGEQTRKREIIGMCWGKQESINSKFYTGTKKGSLGFWDLEKPEILKEIEEVLPEDPISIHFSSKLENKLCSVGANGIVKVFQAETPTPEEEEDPLEFEVSGPISAACCEGVLLATGGRDNGIKLWDLKTQTMIWKAKNVPPDKLDLEVPIWPTAIKFMETDAGGCKLASGTGHRHVRLYDTRVQRRPVHSWEALPHRCTALVISPREDGVIAADGTGDIREIDLRTGKVRGRYVGPGGSVRDLAVHPTQGYLASVGLDRMLRIHKIGRRDAVKTVYLKQRLNKVMFCEDPWVESPAVANEEGKDDGSDWESYDEDNENNSTGTKSKDGNNSSRSSADDSEEDEHLEDYKMGSSSDLEQLSNPDDEIDEIEEESNVSSDTSNEEDEHEEDEVTKQNNSGFMNIKDSHSEPKRRKTKR
mmetsp:Transcript_30816/g.40716  ORF Transcript_30816/g.40716 Transcript_30816/m.40716 type:complete len:441 (-) Transcript_30816:89-1411(-)